MLQRRDARRQQVDALFRFAGATREPAQVNAWLALSPQDNRVAGARSGTGGS
jgi:hypothetical protein